VGSFFSLFDFRFEYNFATEDRWASTSVSRSLNVVASNVLFVSDMAVLYMFVRSYDRDKYTFMNKHIIRSDALFEIEIQVFPGILGGKLILSPLGMFDSRTQSFIKLLWFSNLASWVALCNSLDLLGNMSLRKQDERNSNLTMHGLT